MKRKCVYACSAPGLARPARALAAAALACASLLAVAAGPTPTPPPPSPTSAPPSATASFRPPLIFGQLPATATPPPPPPTASPPTSTPEPGLEDAAPAVNVPTTGDATLRPATAARSAGRSAAAPSPAPSTSAWEPTSTPTPRPRPTAALQTTPVAKASFGAARSLPTPVGSAGGGVAPPARAFTDSLLAVVGVVSLAGGASWGFYHLIRPQKD